MSFPLWYTTTFPDPAPLPVMSPWYVGEPEARTWVERSDGTRLDELRGARLDPPSWEENNPGESTLSVPLDDLGLAPLLTSTSQGTVLATVYDEDVEIAHYLQGADVWRGPLVTAEHTWGVASLRAFTQDWYLSKQFVGGPETINYLAREGETSGGYFDEDPDLDRWTIDSGVTATTMVGGEEYLWRRDKSAAVLATTLGQGMRSDAELPVGLTRNYAYVVVRVLVTDGADVMTDGSQAWVATVQHYTAAPDSGAFATEGDAKPMLLPDGWQRGKWQWLTLAVPQLANRRNMYRVKLYGGVGNYVIFGEVEVVRDDNVSALAGTDVGTLHASLYRHLIRLMPDPDAWTRRNDPCGELLVDDVRHLARDHNSARDVMAPWEQLVDWGVELDPVTRKKVMWAGPRGTLRLDAHVTSDALAGWRAVWDATDAVNELIAGAAGLDGPGREEHSAVVGGATHRLPGRAQMRGGLSVRDLVGWAERELAASGTTVSIEGVPAEWTGEILSKVRVADRVKVRVADGPLDYQVTAAIQRLTWNPYTNRVTPVWRVL